MSQDALLAYATRWWRPVAALLVVAVAWLLAAPRGPAPTSLALSGPKLDRPTTPAQAGEGAPKPAATPAVRHVVVHVAGAVARPGVYRVRAPGRLIDAVRRAGGLTGDADLTQINLAARLSDGRAIIVPSASASASASTSGAAAAVGDAEAGRSGGAAPRKINVNTATAEQLQTLDGVGPAMAAAIIALRGKLGGFTRLDQLDDVPGVGEKRLASLRAQLDL